MRSVRFRYHATTDSPRQYQIPVSSLFVTTRVPFQAPRNLFFVTGLIYMWIYWLDNEFVENTIWPANYFEWLAHFNGINRLVLTDVIIWKRFDVSDWLANWLPSEQKRNLCPLFCAERFIWYSIGWEFGNTLIPCSVHLCVVCVTTFLLIVINALVLFSLSTPH